MITRARPRAIAVAIVLAAAGAGLGLWRATDDPPYEERLLWQRPTAEHTVASLQVDEIVPALTSDDAARPLVTLGPTALLVGDAVVMDVPPRHVLGESGFGAIHKLQGASSFALTPLVHSLMLATPRDVSPEGPGVCVTVRAETPYRALAEILGSAYAAGARRVVLLANGPGQHGSGNGFSWSPRVVSGGRPQTTTLPARIDLLLVPEGAALATDEGPVGPGCTRAPGLTVPASSGSSGTPRTPGSSGTPRTPGSSGTPRTSGSSGTPRTSGSSFVSSLHACIAALHATLPGTHLDLRLFIHPAVPVEQVASTLLGLRRLTDPDVAGPGASVLPTSIEEWQALPSRRGGRMSTQQQLAMMERLAQMELATLGVLSSSSATAPAPPPATTSAR